MNSIHEQEKELENVLPKCLASIVVDYAKNTRDALGPRNSRWFKILFKWMEQVIKYKTCENIEVLCNSFDYHMALINLEKPNAHNYQLFGLCCLYLGGLQRKEEDGVFVHFISAGAYSQEEYHIMIQRLKTYPPVHLTTWPLVERMSKFMHPKPSSETFAFAIADNLDWDIPECIIRWCLNSITLTRHRYNLLYVFREEAAAFMNVGGNFDLTRTGGIRATTADRLGCWTFSDLKKIRLSPRPKQVPLVLWADIQKFLQNC